MKNFKKRKGFTLTELAIVIAVIAILIAVLVPTFISLISSANESADQQAVSSMNNVLASDEVINGKPDSASDAMDVLEANGFNVEKYVALDSGNTIYYDLTYNRCLIWTTNDDGTGSVTYPSDLAATYASAKGIAANWYTFETIYDIKNHTTTVSTTSELSTAINNAKNKTSAGETVIIELEEDIGTVSYASALSWSKEVYVTIDLNGNTLNMSSTSTSSYSTIKGGATLYIKDGSLTTATKNKYSSFYVESNSSITLENVTVTSDYSTKYSQAVIYPKGDSAQVNIIDSDITSNGAYCVSTNAETVDNYNVTINIQNSELICSGGATVLFNVPGTYTVTDSTIVTAKGYPAFIARGGDITIDNCMIATSLHTYTTHSSIWNRFMDDCTYTTSAHSNDGYYKKWQSGNGTPYAALCIGNDADSTDYPYHTSCTVTNTEFHTGLGFMCVYVEGNSTEAYGATFTYSGCSFYYHSVTDDSHPSIMDDIDNGTGFSNVTPTEYSSSLYNSNYTNPLDYAIIYTNDSASYVTINGTVYQDGN